MTYAREPNNISSKFKTFEMGEVLRCTTYNTTTIQMNELLSMVHYFWILVKERWKPLDVCSKSTNKVFINFVYFLYINYLIEKPLS